jgi:hypothetical protein
VTWTEVMEKPSPSLSMFRFAVDLLGHEVRHAERVAALHMIEPHADRPQAITLAADKAYDAEDFVNTRAASLAPEPPLR